MADFPSAGDVTRLLGEYEREYGDAHREMSDLRRIYHGEYWQVAGVAGASTSELLRDLRGLLSSDSEPTMKFVANYLKSVADSYQALLGHVPQVIVPVEPTSDPDAIQPGKTKRSEATYKERFIYAVWTASRMNRMMKEIGWDLPVLGSTVVGVLPDMRTRMVRFRRRSPQFAFPIPSHDDPHTFDGMLFAFEEDQSKLARLYPRFRPELDRRGNPLQKVKYIEYWSKTVRVCVAGGKVLSRLKHDFGYVPWQIPKFGTVADEVFGESIIAQWVHLNMNLNMMLSLETEAVIGNVFPRWVLVDPSKAPEELDTSHGAVWGVNPGGDVKILAPGSAVADLSRPMERNLRAIQDGTHHGRTMFGEAQGSVITGKGMSQLQAPTLNLADFVQSDLGECLSVCNEWAMHMQRKVFGNERETKTVYARYRTGAADLRDTWAKVDIQPSRLKPPYTNECIFQPQMNAHEKLVMLLQGLGGNLWSKKYARDNLGLPDSDAMEQEMAGEKMREIFLEGMLAQAQQGQIGLGAESQAAGLLTGAVPASPGTTPAPPALPPASPAASPGGGGEAVFAPVSGPPDISDLLNQGGGEIAPAPEGAAPEDTVTFDEAVAAFPVVEKIRGRVFLVGDILPQPFGVGETDLLEVAVTVGLDKKTLLDQLTQFDGLIRFLKLGGNKTPNQPYFEVTPGNVSPEVVDGAAPDAVQEEMRARRQRFLSAPYAEEAQRGRIPVKTGAQEPPLAASYKQPKLPER